jgi:hypothetical protein
MTNLRVTPSRADMPRLARWLRPLVDRVASLPVSVHTKLLAGFLIGAGLLLSMAALSLAVQARMSDRVAEINLAQERLDGLRRMQYLITSQSHFRTMALLTHDEANDAQPRQQLAQAKPESNAIELAAQLDVQGDDVRPLRRHPRQGSRAIAVRTGHLQAGMPRQIVLNQPAIQRLVLHHGDPYRGHGLRRAGNS